MRTETRGPERSQRPEPVRVRVDTHSDPPDTAGDIIWPKINTENKRALEQRVDSDLKSSTKDIITKRLDLGGDAVSLWAHFSDQMKELSSTIADRRADAVAGDVNAQTEVKNGERQLQRVRYQLEALADHQARNRVLSFLVNEKNPQELLERIAESKDLHREIMAQSTSHDTRLNSAAAWIMRRAEKSLVQEMVDDPSKIETLRAEQKAFMDKVLKATGGIGGSAEISFTPTKKMSPGEAGARKQLAWAEQKLIDVKDQLKGLGWFERTFGQGKDIKARLPNLEDARKKALKAVSAETIGSALKGSESRFAPSELPDSAIAEFSPIDNAWQTYQDNLKALSDLQGELKTLSRWPWKDREAKAELAQEIKKQEYFAKKAKAEHGREVRAASLEKDRARNETME